MKLRIKDLNKINNNLKEAMIAKDLKEYIRILNEDFFPYITFRDLNFISFDENTNEKIIGIIIKKFSDNEDLYPYLPNNLGFLSVSLKPKPKCEFVCSTFIFEGKEYYFTNYIDAILFDGIQEFPKIMLKILYKNQ